MTREEAIKELSYIADEMPSMECAIWLEAISMAIKALEQEPCADAISRQAVDDAIYDYSRSCDVNYAQIMEYIEKIPSIKPQYTDTEIQKMQDLEFAEIQKAYEIGKVEKSNKWIPVSERLPEEETDVLICNGNGDIEISRGSYSTEVANDFIWYTSGWLFGKVTAWMPLPEPYKASPTGVEGSEEND